MDDQRAGVVLRISPDTRRTLIAIFTAILTIVIVGLVLSLMNVIHNPNPSGQMIGLTLIFVVGGMLLILGIVRSRVVLHPDRIEVTRNLSPTRTIARADIVARRLHPYAWRGSAYYIFITRDGKEVSLPPYLEHGKVLQQWMADIPLASTRR